jgi:hypothetical protein
MIICAQSDGLTGGGHIADHDGHVAVCLLSRLPVAMLLFCCLKMTKEKKKDGMVRPL